MLQFRKATEGDIDLYFQWANDLEVRAQSYSSEPITIENHIAWFQKRIHHPDFLLLVFENENAAPVGQVRIENKKDHAIIGASVDKNFRGKKYASEMLKLSAEHWFGIHPGSEIFAYIKKNNPASLHAFQSAGFILKETTTVEGIESYICVLKNIRS